MKYPRLKARRVELGYSQDDMAKMLGISLSTYCHKEKGKTSFNIEEIIKLVLFLNCKFEDIFLSR